MGIDPLSLGIIALGAASAGLSIAGGVAAQERSEKQAEAIALEGKIKANERAKQVRRLASQQKVSFLSSGIALTGEGTPMSVLGETFQFGAEDIDLITQNYQTQVENVLSRGRSEFLTGLGQGITGFAGTIAPLFGPGAGGASAISGATPSGVGGRFTSAFDVERGQARFGF